MLKPIKKLIKKAGHAYAAAGYPLLPLTRLFRAPLRWLYHRSPLFCHDDRFHFKTDFLVKTHKYFIREHPSDFLIYHNQIKFRSHGSLMSAHGYYVGEIEFHLLKFIIDRMRPGFVMLDVGAHHGVFTTVAAFELKSRGWDGVVHAFEPNPQNFALLEHNVQQNGLEKYVRLHQTAASNIDGRQQFLINRDENSDNMLASTRSPEWSKLDFLVPCEVPSLCLDSLLATLPKVNLIKMDVQGGEPEALAGAQQLIERDRPILIIEANPSSESTPRVKKFLLEHRYVIHGINARSQLCQPNSPDAYVVWDWIALPE